ncbi:MAG: sulfotransferase [Pseudomonadales bacterium]|nr:sulfotransferase [Pseudomonadales bacterium]
MRSPLFLIGTQRSGTTLLTKMLSAHKDIYVKNEVPVLKVFTPGASRKDIEHAIDGFIKEGTGKSIEALLQSENKSVWGLKDPQLTEHLEALKQFAPDVGFIIITRDARAVVRSYIENAWGLGTNCYTGALRWRDEVQAQLDFEKEMQGHVMRLRYEDLVLQQRESLEKICAFIGVPFDEAAMNYNEQKTFVTKKRESINTFKAPDPAIITKWKSQLTDHQVGVINGVCGDLLDQLGYSDTQNRIQLPGVSQAYYRMHQAVVGEFQIQYRWRIGRYKRAVNGWLNG